ncbi:unnamed protein product, partial [Hydatigera taeniaeformis]|uniref:Methyltransferase n=1 Tax=Hydatigena taeniaeformis TaxID=6205 RepID=A0A0R3XC01_HYDTA
MQCWRISAIRQTSELLRCLLCGRVNLDSGSGPGVMAHVLVGDYHSSGFDFYPEQIWGPVFLGLQ